MYIRISEISRIHKKKNDYTKYHKESMALLMKLNTRRCVLIFNICQLVRGRER